MKFFGRIGFIFLSFFILSCHNLLSEPGNSGQNSGNGTVRVSGTLTFSNDIAPYIQNHLKDSRALPSLDSHQFTVLMQAHNSDNSQIVPISVTNNSFSVALSSDTWTFQTHIYYDSTSNPHDDFSSNDYCFSAEDTLTVGTTNINDFKLECELDTSAAVNVPLNFTVYKDTNITKYVFWKEGIVTTDPELISYDSNTYATKNVSTAYTPGLNSFIIYFKDANDNVIYTLEDTILVLKGCENYIYVNNNEGYVDGGQIKITSDVIQKRHANKIYFVDSSVTDDSTRTGTFFDPVASIQKAVNLIDSVNDGTSEYEIRLNTDFTDNSSSEYPLDNDYAYIKIKPAKTLNLKISSSDTSKKTININRSSSKLGRILSVNSTDSTTSPTNLVTLYLENIIFKNGNKDDGGACNFHNAKITIKNCEFNNNTASSSGGAISARDTVTELNIESTSFYQNRVHVLYNSTNGFGGAIDLLTGCNLTNCTFRENHVERESSAGSGLCHGGAIYASFGETIPNRVLNVEGCSFINNTSEIRGTGGAITITGNTLLNLNSTTSVNPTIFKYNYSPEANAIKHLGDELNIYDKVYFNNLNNSEDSLYSTYSSYDSKIDIVYAQKLMSGGGYKYPSINLNFTKSDDKTLSQVFPTDCYSNNYIYAVIKPINNTGVSLTDTNITIKDNNSEDAKSNHIYKFIPIETVDLNNRKYFLTNQGQFTFSPELSSLLQCPEGMDGQNASLSNMNYLVVKTKEDFAQLLTWYTENISVSKNNLYKQVNDIELTGTGWTWRECNFADTYDGQGYKLSNLTVSSGGYNTIGLFSSVVNGYVKNVILENPKITNSLNNPGVIGAGGICFRLQSSTLENCSVINGQIKARSYVGGVAGYLNVASTDSSVHYDPSYIINCSFNGKLESGFNATSGYIGGILGYTNGAQGLVKIINCLFDGYIVNPLPNTIKSGFVTAHINQNAGFVYNCFVHGYYTDGTTPITGSATKLISNNVGENPQVFNTYADTINFTDEQQAGIPSTMTNDDTKYINQSYTKSISLDGDLVISGNKTNTKIDIYKYNSSTSDFAAGNLTSIYTVSSALNKFVEINNAVSSFTTNYCQLKLWTYDTEHGVYFSTDNSSKNPPELICPALHTEPENTTTTPIWIRCEEDFMALNGWNKSNTIELKTDLFLLGESYSGIGTSMANAVSLKLNGNNHTISYNDDTGVNSFVPALIGYADNIIIKDLTVHGGLALCWKDAHSSILVSSIKQGTIENCTCILDSWRFDDVSPIDGFIFGGVVGKISNKFDLLTGTDSDDNQEQVVIKNCIVKFLEDGDLFQDFYEDHVNIIFGGIIGQISGKQDNAVIIDKCFVGPKTKTETIYSPLHHTDKSVLDKLLTDEILDKSSCFGGILGNIVDSKAVIVNCLSRQAMSVHNAYIGGIVGLYGKLNTSSQSESGLELKILNCLASNFDNSLGGKIYVSGIVNTAFTDYPTNLTILHCVDQYGPTSTPNPGDYYCYAIANSYEGINFNISDGYTNVRNMTSIGSRPAYRNATVGSGLWYVAESNLLSQMNSDGYRTILNTVYATDYVKWKVDSNYFNRFYWNE